MCAPNSHQRPSIKDTLIFANIQTGLLKVIRLNCRAPYFIYGGRSCVSPKLNRSIDLSYFNSGDDYFSQSVHKQQVNFIIYIYYFLSINYKCVYDIGPHSIIFCCQCPPKLLGLAERSASSSLRNVILKNNFKLFI